MASKGKAQFRIVIDGSQQAIFDELTRTDRPLGAIYNSRMHTTGLTPGSRMQMRTVSGDNVIVDGSIIEYEPPYRFSHWLTFTQHGDPPCKVTYDLKPVTGGIEVTLTVDDMPLDTKTSKGMSKGGHFILATLKSIVETGRPPLGTRMIYGLMNALEFMLPKKCRTSQWPLEAKGERK